MSENNVEIQWLFFEGLRIALIILTGFIAIHFIDLFIDEFEVELLFGIRSTLVEVGRLATIITALLYAIRRGTDAS